MDERELTRDTVNNLPGDERDAGWDAGEEHERGPVNAPGVRPR
jgi:hypothetical protein